MKNVKKIMAFLVAMVMILAMSVTAFASETPSTYTITMDTSSGHTYTAYQVFKGDLEGSTLSNIQWGDDVNGEGLLNALKADATYGSNFTNCTTASDVAKVLGTYTSNSADINAIAKIIAANKKGNGHSGTTSITGLAAGYYLVVDSTAASEMPAGNTYSDFMLEVVKDVNITAKDTTTTSEKKVKDINDSAAAPATGDNYTDWQDSADYDVNDVVPFKLTGTVASDYAKYETYYFAFHDKESNGLTFNNESVKVYVDGEEITTGYEVKTTGLEDGCTFEVVFNNLKTITSVKAGSVITVEYTSTVNENAVMGSLGNPNTSYIEFSNNPNGDQHGKTPDDTVIVFTYKVVVNKVDENKDPLEGAGFTLYKKNDTGAYVAVGEELKGDAMTTFTWNRLDDGDYRLVETTTPSGKNTIDPIEFTITADHEVLSDSPALNSLSGNVTSGVAEFTASVPDGSLTTNVVNESGTVLPSTGGMGTTMLYLGGAILVLGAGILLITRRRMAAK